MYMFFDSAILLTEIYLTYNISKWTDLFTKLFPAALFLVTRIITRVHNPNVHWKVLVKYRIFIY